MKIRHLVIVSLILAILAMGAVSASDDIVADDNLAVEDAIDDSIVETEDLNEGEIIAADCDDDAIGSSSFNEDGIYGYFNDDTQTYNPKQQYMVFAFGVSDLTKINGSSLNISVNGNQVYTKTINRTFYDYIYLYNTDLGMTDYGEYLLNVTYNTNSSGISEIKEHTHTFTINYKMEMEASSLSISFYYSYGDDLLYSIRMPVDVTGKLTLTVNGREYDVKYKDGRGYVIVPTKDWDLGNYTAVAKVTGDDKFNISCEKTIALEPKIVFLQTLMGNDAIMSVGENEAITIVAPSGANGSVEITLNSSSQVIDSRNITLSNGYGSYSLSNLPEGEYIVSLQGQIGTYKLNVVSPLEVVNNSEDCSAKMPQSEITEGNGANIIISAIPTSRIIVYVDDIPDKMYTGVGEINDWIFGLSVGTHKVRVVVDILYGDFYSKTFYITVKEKAAPSKDTIKLTLNKAKVKKSAKKLVLKSTLKVNGKAKKGLVVKFKFNKKTYSAKTDAKGIAKVTIKKAVLKKLKAGKKLTYQASYGKTVKKITVKVLK